MPVQGHAFVASMHAAAVMHLYLQSILLMADQRGGGSGPVEGLMGSRRRRRKEEEEEDEDEKEKEEEKETRKGGRR